MSTVLKNFQTSGFLSMLMSAVMTCLSLSLHLSRSTRGEAGRFDAVLTISACLGVDPHPRVPPARATETSSDIRVLDMSMAATVGRNARFIKSSPGPTPRFHCPSTYGHAWSCHGEEENLHDHLHHARAERAAQASQFQDARPGGRIHSSGDRPGARQGKAQSPRATSPRGHEPPLTRPKLLSTPSPLPHAPDVHAHADQPHP